MTKLENIVLQLTNKGCKCKAIYPEWDEPFIKVYNCGLFTRESTADYIRKHGFNCDID